MGKVGAASVQPLVVSNSPFATISGHRAWVILDTMGYIADRDNATRAEALTSTGQPIAVSFFAAEPPAISHFCVHYPGLDLAAEPRVVHSAGNLALLKLCLNHGPTANAMAPHKEYFLYRAASRRGRLQSLEPLPGLHRHLSKLTALASIAVVPCGDDGSEHFILAALGLTFMSGQYDLHVFRSEKRRWTVKVVALGEQAAMDPEKVIVLGGGVIGWVDLLRGILVCNQLDENPVLRVIPLPRLLPGNRVHRSHSVPAKQFRDVVCVDGVIKLVELEYCRRRIVPDVSMADVLYDSELTLGEDVDTEKVTYYYEHLGWSKRIVQHSSKVQALHEEELTSGDMKDTYEYNGWRLLTWNRTVSSDCWRRGSLVHVDDIVVHDRRHSVLLPQLVEKSTGKNLQAGCPTLSVDGSDVVYLKSKVEQKDTVVAVDTRKKTAVGVAPFSDERYMHRNPTYITCALSKYLNTV